MCGYLCTSGKNQPPWVLFFNDEPTLLGYRDLDYNLAGKSTIPILIYTFPCSGSLVKNINSFNASKWHVVIKCSFPFFQKSLIANSFMPDFGSVLLYSWSSFGATAAYVAACAMLLGPTGMVSEFLQTRPVTTPEALSCSCLPPCRHLLMEMAQWPANLFCLWQKQMGKPLHVLTGHPFITCQISISNWGNRARIYDPETDLVHYQCHPWSGITAKVETGVGTKMLQRTVPLSNHQKLKYQVPHRLWFSLVVSSVYKGKQKYRCVMLRLAASAFTI